MTTRNTQNVVANGIQATGDIWLCEVPVKRPEGNVRLGETCCRGFVGIICGYTSNSRLYLHYKIKGQ